MNAVQAGLITWEQAGSWFGGFFSGSQYLVPIFCEKHDVIESVAARSAFLLDAIVSIGCRAEEGFSSQTFRQLQARLRDHLARLLINAISPICEDIQAITLMAAYSENGAVLTALALRFAIQLGLPKVVDQLVARCTGQSGLVDGDEQELYRLSRLWYGVCNIELFFSLDGGKLPGMALHVSPRKIRSLLNHPERTAVDVRLLSQIELNVIRTEAYSKLINTSNDSSLVQDETRLRTILDDTSIELSLWHGEWANVVSTDPSPHQRPVALQNLNIQHQWALMTLHLKAIAVTGIENIALMTTFQQDSVRKAKEAAAVHLHCILDTSVSYLGTFKWTLDYVWAKCAFSVLLVLKLAILLRDPIHSVILLLRDAHRLLEELKRVTIGHIAYFQILQTSIEKCEAALREYVSQQTASSDPVPTPSESAGLAEDDFQGYAPSEFIFEWDFPGLNLKHMPLGWQDYFINIEGLI
ncbi:C6 zinc finger domain-containing protein [Ophiobolus disseminans]|uniref:C6 zinc finger domain-containing protein n=1 Tax=Ophiobolus disseminans TaxID=1469910 RepID=A0A6A6ZEW7_9PLEO|nr:C6 zinc finger domain-containing protein [Ophiobolus disseminans]